MESSTHKKQKNTIDTSARALSRNERGPTDGGGEGEGEDDVPGPSSSSTIRRRGGETGGRGRSSGWSCAGAGRGRSGERRLPRGARGDVERSARGGGLIPSGWREAQTDH
ncbi:hypothetical protein ACHAWF_012150 [Thalassiosira exigua]